MMCKRIKLHKISCIWKIIGDELYGGELFDSDLLSVNFPKTVKTSQTLIIIIIQPFLSL